DAKFRLISYIYFGLLTLISQSCNGFRYTETLNLQLYYHVGPFYNFSSSDILLEFLYLSCLSYFRITFPVGLSVVLASTITKLYFILYSFTCNFTACHVSKKVSIDSSIRLFSTREDIV